MEQKEKPITLELTLYPETYKLLEALAYSLKWHEETPEADNDIADGWCSQKKNYSPLLANFLTDICDSLSTGIRRPGSWEGEVILMLTGWNGSLAKEPGDYEIELMIDAMDYQDQNTTGNRNEQFND